LAVEWTEVAGTVGKVVYFTFNDCDGDPFDLTGYATKTLKVWNDEGAVLKFSGAFTNVTPAIGYLSYTIAAGDIAVGDEGLWFWEGEFTSAGGVTILSNRASLKITQGVPV